MGTSTTALSLAALFWAFVQAPFLHVHPDLTDHPANSIAHLHLDLSGDSTGPAIGAHTPDEDAIDVDWRIASPPTVEFAVSLTPAETAIVAPMRPVAEAVSIPQARAHDPPDLGSKPPRSPPV